MDNFDNESIKDTYQGLVEGVPQGINYFLYISVFLA
jgi:hypothetical protein